MYFLVCLNRETYRLHISEKKRRIKLAKTQKKKFFYYMLKNRMYFSKLFVYQVANNILSLLQDTRKRKGLKEGLPDLSAYLDKL